METGMNMKHALALAGLLAAVPLFAATINVPSDQATLAEAVAAAQDGDVILVADGTYQPTEEVIVDKAVEIAGNDADPSQVVFDGQAKYKLIGIANGGAFVHGVTFSKGQGNSTASSLRGEDYFHGCSVEMNAGTISNCVVKSGKANYAGCLSIWGTAKVFDSEIRDGYNSDGNGGAAGIGGSLKMRGTSLVRGCLIAGGNAVCGGGVFVRDNAVLADCVVSNNTARGSNGGGGIRVLNSGVVSNCVVVANTVASGGGGGIFQKNSSKVYCSLVCGNSAKTGGGVYMEDANSQLVNCTVADNSAALLGANLYRAEKTAILNTIVAGGVVSEKGGDDTTSFFDAIPGFRDAANGDYTLKGSSVCIDAGTAQDWGAGATDVSLVTPRVLGSAVDLGAYEYDAAAAPVAASFFADVPSGADYPAAVTFTPAVEGAAGNVLSVEWDFGDGSSSSGDSLAAVSHTYASAGNYTVSLTVETTQGGSIGESQTIVLKTFEVYVSKTGSATPPYSTAVTAAHSLADALGALVVPASGRGIVHVADGTYQVSGVALLADAVEIVGNDADPSRVVFDGQKEYKLVGIANDDVFIHGVTFANGKGDATSNLSGCPDWFSGCSFEMNAGTVSNCVVASGEANYAGCLSIWGTAKVLDSEIRDGYNRDGNANNAGRGGSLKMTGRAVVRGCRISGGSAVRGGGVTVEGNALMAESTVAGASARGTIGGGVNVEGSGVVSNCVVMSNTNGGVALKGSGAVFNALIVSNTAPTGAGLNISGGRVVNCTIADNTATTDGSGVYQTGGSIVNTIIAGPTAAFSSAGGTISCSAAAALVSGTDGNIGETDPGEGFRDAASGDYTLMPSSPCVDAGSVALEWPDDAVDLSGSTTRVLDGRGSGFAVVDIGAYEYDRANTPVSLNVRIAIISATATGEVATVRLTPSIDGAYGEIVSAAWNFGDGATDAGGTLAELVHDYAFGATFVVSLEVATTQAGTLSTTVDVTTPVLVSYVSTTGSATAPYDTPAKATTSIADALSVLGEPTEGPAKVVVADGTYAAPDERIFLSAVEIAGNDADPSQVVFDGDGSKPFFFLDDANAFLHGLTFHRGWFSGDDTSARPAAYSSASLEARAGVISNCIVRSGRASFSGGVTVWGTGRLIGCVVSECENTDPNGDIAAKGGGIKIYQNAYVSGCTFTNNQTKCGGGVAVFGGTLENCVIHANRATSSPGGGGIHMEGGIVRNILVYGNSSEGSGGGVNIKNANAVLESATVVDNAAKGDGRDVYMTAGALTNSIVFDACAVYDSEHPPLVVAGGTVAYCCSPSLTDGADGNISAAPLFKDAANGDYTVLGGSPTVDAGVNAEWMVGAVDLSGNARVAKRRVDMGCYESAGRLPLVLIVR